MVPHTSPVHYYSEEIYNLEKEKIFYKTWQFAGFTMQLQNHNDFVSFELCDKAIVVQNFQGELRAFANVCSHRYARIQNEPCGNRLLQCPYHGWTYNKEGIPIGIPCKEDFENLDKNKLGLEQYKVEVCGKLVFVSLDQNSISLKTHLAGLYDRLEKMSLAIDQCVDTYTLEIDCNWKIPIENSLEGYHVNYIHQSTIKKFEVGQNALKDCEIRFNFDPPHSYLVDEVGAAELEKWLKVSKIIGPTAFQATDYSQHNIFPNLNLATFYGSAYFIQVFRPLSLNKCRIDHYSLSSRLLEPTKTGELIYSQILSPMVDLGKKILDEDVGICLKVQKGISSARATGVLSREEERLQKYQESYMNYITN